MRHRAEELGRAVQLFNQGDFVGATTLAGAAEEVLGRIARKRAGTNALDCNRLRLLLFMYPSVPSRCWKNRRISLHVRCR